MDGRLVSSQSAEEPHLRGKSAGKMQNNLVQNIPVQQLQRFFEWLANECDIDKVWQTDAEDVNNQRTTALV